MSLIIEKNVRVSQAGFSLIELAVVLVIIGILISGFIGTLGSRIDSSRQIETREKLEKIKASLYGFAMAKLNPPGVVRLPCPDVDNDGLEDLVPPAMTQCAVLTGHGNLPWRTLGIERGDAWSSTYSYWVTDEYSNMVGFTLATDGSGTGRVMDATAGNVLSGNVAAVIFSHGKNQSGSIGLDNVARNPVPAGAQYLDERENTDTDAAAPVLFISRPVTGDDAPIIYDDILTWISEYELKGRMAQAGALP
ncbi:MAG: prepilin-type N-terminal cleavage/methylation domain-containing protein [Gammaproteobacteria bacterium]|nr:prepilin-type N-terminal cleavage/methylation domain-containing protein [Gammaproteobacteria bacterium]